MTSLQAPCRDDWQPPADSRREERRTAILDAAEALFLERGFAKVSLGAVVRRSGGSLATLYAMFGNKRGLLRAVVYRRRDEHMWGFLHPDPGKSLRENLCHYALGCYAFITTPRIVALLRIVIGESISDPAFGQEFYTGFNGDAMAQLASIFRQWTEEGRARIEEPDAAVTLFFGTVMCDAPTRAMLGMVPQDMDADQMRRRLAPFLEYYGIE